MRSAISMLQITQLASSAKKKVYSLFVACDILQTKILSCNKSRLKGDIVSIKKHCEISRLQMTQLAATQVLGISWDKIPQLLFTDLRTIRNWSQQVLQTCFDQNIFTIVVCIGGIGTARNQTSSQSRVRIIQSGCFKSPNWPIVPWQRISWEEFGQLCPLL